MKQQRLRATDSMVRDALGPKETLSIQEQDQIVTQLCWNFGVTKKKAREYIDIIMGRIKLERIDPEAVSVLDRYRNLDTTKQQEKDKT
jgi:hypothetical protein